MITLILALIAAKYKFEPEFLYVVAFIFDVCLLMMLGDIVAYLINPEIIKGGKV